MSAESGSATTVVNAIPLLDHGAEPREAVKDVAGDIKVATVADPFGNVIGLIQNLHFKMKA